MSEQNVQVNVKRWNEAHLPRVTYQQVYKKCGKDNCKCRRGFKHGPYWYKISWDKKKGKIKRESLGTVDMPAEAIAALQAKRFSQGETAKSLGKKVYELEQRLFSLQKEKDQLSKHLDLVWVDFQRAKRDASQKAKTITELRQEISRLQAELYVARIDAAGVLSDSSRRAGKVYKRLARKYHPDRDPVTAEFMKDLNELWQEIKNI